MFSYVIFGCQILFLRISVGFPTLSPVFTCSLPGSHKYSVCTCWPVPWPHTTQISTPVTFVRVSLITEICCFPPSHPPWLLCAVNSDSPSTSGKTAPLGSQAPAAPPWLASSLHPPPNTSLVWVLPSDFSRGCLSPGSPFLWLSSDPSQSHLLSWNHSHLSEDSGISIPASQLLLRPFFPSSEWTVMSSALHMVKLDSSQCTSSSWSLWLKAQPCCLLSLVFWLPKGHKNG